MRYYINSNNLNVKELLRSTRLHWLAESIHLSLDTIFGDDACRKRAEESAENFARIREMCLDMLKSETTFSASIKHKGAMCVMGSEYLLKVLRVFIDGDVHDFSVFCHAVWRLLFIEVSLFLLI